MRILTVITKSISYIKDFYAHHRFLASKSYEDQYEALVNDTYGGSEIWSTGLLRFGYESTRVYINIPYIQKRWAQEQGIQNIEEYGMENIVKDQICKFQPDILFINNHTAFPSEFVKNLRAEIPSIRLVVGWCGSSYRDSSIFHEYDIVLSNIPELVEGFRSRGHCCYHLNHAFDPRVLEKITAHELTPVDFSFLGSIVKSDGYHNERESLLVELIKTTELEIWSAAKSPTLRQYIRILASQFGYDTFQYLLRTELSKKWLAKEPMVARISRIEKRPDFDGFVDHRIARRARPPLFGHRMFQELIDSKVTLNTHTNISPKSASNMRLFEATGVGTCLLTDWKENLKDLFEPDIEVATYRDSRECIEKVKYLLQNEPGRRAIAEAGQRRTLREHTIYHRAEKLDAIIQSHLRNV